MMSQHCNTIDNPPNLDITATTLSNTIVGGTNGSVTLTFTNQTSLSSENERAITFPSGFDVSRTGINGESTVTTGSDPTLEGVSGQIITLNVPDFWAAGSQTIVLTGIDNPATATSGLSLTVVSQANNGSATIDQADVTPVTFVVRAHLNLAATSLDNSFTNATGVTATVTRSPPSRSLYQPMKSSSFFPQVLMLAAQ